MPVTKHTFIYKMVGDLSLQADVYRGDVAGRAPVVVWIHGGALIVGHRAGISVGAVERLTAAGCTVVSIDYRLAPETKLGAIIEDVRDAFAWVRADGRDLFGCDPTRVAAMGSSAGGYLTLMAGLHVRPRLRALVSVAGYGDVIGDWYSRPDPFYLQQPRVDEATARAAVGTRPTVGGDGQGGRGAFYLYCRQTGLWPREVTGHDPGGEPHAFRPYCPVLNVTDEYPPTLLIHGDHDTDVPYEQSVMMAEALRDAGVEHELITIERGSHGSMGNDAAEVEATWQRVLAFLVRHLAG